MKIIINERQLKKIVRLFESEQDVTEVLGVPDNIHETAVEIFNAIKNHLINIEQTNADEFNKDIEQRQHKIDTIIINGNFRIADFNFKKIEYNLSIYQIKKPKNAQLPNFGNMAASLPADQLIDKNNKVSLTHMENKLTDELKLSGNLYIPEIKEDGTLFGISDINEFIEKTKNKTIAVLTHELKHAYDHKKNPYTNIKEMSYYQAPMQVRPNIEEINDFLFYMYYIENLENTVRPSEIYSYMRSGEINQEDFKKFMDENEVFVNLKKIMNYDYAGFLSRIGTQESDIDAFIDEINRPEIKSFPLTKKIKIVLDILFDAFKDSVITDYTNKISTKPHAFRFNPNKGGIEVLYMPNTPEEEKAVEKIKKEFLKYKNADDFFESQMERIKYVAYNLYKKISKLYALATPNSNKEPNKFFR